MAPSCRHRWARKHFENGQYTVVCTECGRVRRPAFADQPVRPVNTRPLGRLASQRGK